MNGVIYKLTSPSGKSYIGQTRNHKQRMSGYRRADCKSQPAIYKAIVKYGVVNFVDEILESGIKTQEELDAREEYWIAALNTLAPNGYNLQAGVGGSAWNRGKKMSPESIAKSVATRRAKRQPGKLSAMRRAWRDEGLRV